MIDFFYDYDKSQLLIKAPAVFFLGHSSMFFLVQIKPSFKIPHWLNKYTQNHIRKVHSHKPPSKVSHYVRMYDFTRPRNHAIGC